ncbi:CBS domain-containing protein [Flavobacteriaceae bacterium]|jgi:CBS domain-containing protein|nr:CBS domain-containing protein [Flavobacteriaceae bacterium]|tara:strand:- start:1783 stop:2247 length:465 start_codon:yes stop_codon:yes gene_type:complete
MPVKSFQGERAKKERITPRKLTVSDIMTHNLIVFKPQDTIHEVMTAFIKYRISGGPVLNDQGDLVGVISEADCMKEISDSRYFNMPILDKSVSHFMTKEVDTIQSNLSVFDAAALFSKSSRRRYPVMDENRLVGQVSRKDIVISALNMKSNTWR